MKQNQLFLVVCLWTLQINKQKLQRKYKRLRTLTGGRQTSWLFTERSRQVKLETTESN